MGWFLLPKPLIHELIDSANSRPALPMQRNWPI
jgi:hypothetical protein